jgi:hypothetical protein
MGKQKSSTLLSDNDSEEEQADITTKQKNKPKSSCAQYLTT